METVRQGYLDALPIAAAMITIEDEEPFIECANDLFRLVAEWDERIGDRAIARVPILRAGPIGNRLGVFIKGPDSAYQFDTTDGRPIGGRHFTVRFAGLKKVEGQPRRMLLSMIDKTAQVETERSLRSEMLRDTLTGLPNRLSFNEKVDAVLADPNFRDGQYAVLAVDMTRFSRVNECMGAMAGDELLITFARRLVSALRPTDMLARTSGDEFGILMRLNRGMADALRAAERIKTVLTLPFRLSDLEIRVDCAIGCAALTSSVASADEVLRNAQFALKRAKRSGTTQVYEPVEAQAVRRQFSLETELRVAIESEALTLAFQPLVELSSGRVSGFEALARWEHEGQVISPAEFIPVAEESGLIVQLGRWALDHATQTLADWDRRTGTRLPLNISVNLSFIQVSRDDVVGAVAGALAAAGITGDRLTLELTESAVAHDPEKVARTLNALKRLDVRIAMDDFGTGYTSMASLQTLPIDLLKIDQSFVTGMLEDHDSRAIVRAILSLAAALGMQTTAEGIETEALALALGELGCIYGQGFLYSQAMPAEDALTYWLDRNA
ncbi:bifunctional diguanylate cyclase/phosphodiesterase [Sphingosinicella sp. LHD-64]|uniref:putative bifunctional diguanylate cyclase/phosphodiesterase n=1 Tax=Sphingosinicella sp. LHD-64 TaxID=3072139 RepID=UPI00280F1655|nr:bifunctional diguanylate cyclase/phosphodiesterase [Sphingosinicella sp. LHD-64]MDQ8758182.1 bifunctional diguanylate cyclase/phosphodiesterase [Sphingosinicella sp. LHD-64]